MKTFPHSGDVILIQQIKKKKKLHLLFFIKVPVSGCLVTICKLQYTPF